MAALSDKDLAIIIGDGFVAGSAALHEQFLKTVEPKPPSSLTRTGAFLCIALALVSLVGAVYLSIVAADKMPLSRSPPSQSWPAVMCSGVA